jgi:hypothetical protein
VTVREPIVCDIGVVLTRRARAARIRLRITVEHSRTLVSARRGAYNEERMVTRCAWCERFCLDDEWASPPDAGLWSGFLAARTTHGICPDCLAGLAANGKTAPFAD